MVGFRIIQPTDPRYLEYQGMMKVASEGDLEELANLVETQKIDLNFSLQREDGSLSPTLFEEVKNHGNLELLVLLIKKGVIIPPQEKQPAELSSKVLEKIEKVRAYNLARKEVLGARAKKPVNRELLEFKLEKEFSSFCQIL